MTLLQGDCLELMKDISDRSIDLILCDDTTAEVSQYDFGAKEDDAE